MLIALAPGAGQAAAQNPVCSDTPTVSQRISCSEGASSTADIEADLDDLSIFTTGISYQGYGVRLDHRGSGDIDLDMDNVVVVTTGTSADTVYLSHSGAGNIVVDASAATLWSRGASADSFRSIHDGAGDLTVRMRGGSVTATGRDGDGVEAFQQGETGRLAVELTDVSVRATGPQGRFSGFPVGIHIHDLGSGGARLALSNASV